MSLINPGLGPIIWMTLALLIVLLILKKYAWKPIMNALKEREESIEDSLPCHNCVTIHYGMFQGCICLFSNKYNDIIRIKVRFCQIFSAFSATFCEYFHFYTTNTFSKRI